MQRFIQLGDLKIGKGHKIVFENFQDTGSVRRSETEYIETDGTEIDDAYFNARQLEIKGTILANTLTELNQLKRQLINSCTPKKLTDIYYSNGETTYYAQAIGDGVPEFGKRITRNSWAVEFVAYLLVPGFYWLSGTEIETPLFSVIPLLTDTSVLPCVFSTRTSQATVVNDGDVIAYPLIKIFCNDSDGLLPIELCNVTVNKKIALNYEMKTGEIITIDMKKKKISSSINGNIINCISIDSDFWGYQLGENTVKFNATNVYSVSLHRNCYMGV